MIEQGVKASVERMCREREREREKSVNNVKVAKRQSGATFDSRG